MVKYKNVPTKIAGEIFDNNNLSKDREEISWLRLYYILDPEELNGIKRRFYWVRREIPRLREDSNDKESNINETNFILNNISEETNDSHSLHLTSSIKRSINQNSISYSRYGQTAINN